MNNCIVTIKGVVVDNKVFEQQAIQYFASNRCYIVNKICCRHKLGGLVYMFNAYVFINADLYKNLTRTLKEQYLLTSNTVWS